MTSEETKDEEDNIRRIKKNKLTPPRGTIIYDPQEATKREIIPRTLVIWKNLQLLTHKK